MAPPLRSRRIAPQITCRIARPYVPTAHRHLVHRGAGRRRGHRDAGPGRTSKAADRTPSAWSAACRNSPALDLRRLGLVRRRRARDSRGLARRVARAAAHREPRARCAAGRRLPGASWRRSTPASGPARSPTAARRSAAWPAPAMRDFAAEPAADADRAAASAICGSFRQQTGVDRVVVVNLASTEPADDDVEAAASGGTSWRSCSTTSPPTSLPASSLYAIAALDLGMPYINFTPSLGASPPAIQRTGRAARHLPRRARTAKRAKRCSKACWPRCSPPATSKS